MKKIEFHIFKKNTDAVATNRGFYFQYLKTLMLWVDNFLNEVDNEIYCEKEEDILEVDKQLKSYNFYQLKCYAEGFSLNSPEIKDSLLNFYHIFLKLGDDFSGLFYFESNAFFKPKAGKSLRLWYENQKNGFFVVDEFIQETRTILSELIDGNFKKYLQKTNDIILVREATLKIKEFKRNLKSPNFSKFLQRIRWQFNGEIDTAKAIVALIKEVKHLISRLKYDRLIDEKLILAYFLNVIIEKSVTNNPEERLLNNELLSKMLSDTDLGSKVRELLRPEVLQLMQNDFLILDKLDETNLGIEKLSVKIDDLHNELTKKNNTPSISEELKIQLKNWFKILGYKFENFENNEEDFFEFIINISKHRGYDRIMILGLQDVVEITHLNQLKTEVFKHKCDEGWILTYGRISNTVREKSNKDNYKGLYAYTFDELLDYNTEFTEYFSWLENEINGKSIDKFYVPLNCKKDVLDTHSNITIDSNEYVIENYLDSWIDDPIKKHISVLGEFGTGKTWFTLNYAWKKLLEYKNSKAKNLKRTRIPIIIPLRDYAKAASIESLLSEFFFRKHKSPIPNYEAFVELNKMGKLLIIFDGFDEMADRIDSQKMVNNFWELAKTVTENSKVILTCRNEHFPEAKRGRELLNAELKASTQNLIFGAPQFEVLELLKFNDLQIKKVLGFFTTKSIIQRIFKNEILLDLARRPIMTELILDSLNEIKGNKKIDLSRIYLYAIRKKLTKDIKEERTFTSIRDKVFFMCELSWEMLSTDNMSINYRLFPDRIRNLFKNVVREQKDLDHWQYDMMGQTMLIRNDDGDYKPAHRSFLEFFVAFKFGAELGILDDDFTDLVRLNSQNKESSFFLWNEYFQQIDSLSLIGFKSNSLSYIATTFGYKVLTRSILDLLSNMISISSKKVKLALNQLIKESRNKSFEEVRYTITNIIMLLANYDSKYFRKKDLSNLCIQEFKMPDKNEDSYGFRFVDFSYTNFSNSDLRKSSIISHYRTLSNSSIFKAHFSNALLQDFNFPTRQLDSIDFLPTKNIIALGSPDEIVVLNYYDLSIVRRIQGNGWDVVFSKDGRYLAHSGYGVFYLRNTDNFEVEIEHRISTQRNPTAQENGTNLWTGSFAFSADGNVLFIACNNACVYSYDLVQKKELKIYRCFFGAHKVDISSDSRFLACSEFNGFHLWDIQSGQVLMSEKTIKKKLRKYTIRFHPVRKILILTDKLSIRLIELNTFKIIEQYDFKDAGNIVFSNDGNLMFVHNLKEVCIYDFVLKGIKLKINVFEKENYKDLGHIQQVVFNSNNNTFLILLGEKILKFDDKLDLIEDEYLHLLDLSGNDFLGAIGIDKDLIIQIKKNGGIA